MLLNSRRLASGILLSGFALVTLLAQTQVASRLIGTITDPSGAAIPSAQVTVKAPATGFTRTVPTAEDGTFVATDLTPGTYEIQVSKDGFKKGMARGILLQVSQTVRRDVQLEIGSVATTVEVGGHAELVNTYTGQLSQTIDARRVQDLPLNGRDITSLALLVAGATDDNTQASPYATMQMGFASTTPVVNGTRDQENTYYLDGVKNMYWLRRTANVFPNPDSVEEFTLNTSNYSAEYGDTTGAQLSARTKSGTNSLHGSLFEFVRNGNLNARNEFDRTGQNDGLKRNQYGWAVGGPVYIPKIINGKNKLFWFNTFQQTPIRITGAPGFHLGWTAAEKGGNFTDQLTGKTKTVTSPLCDGTNLTVDTGAVLDPTTANSKCGSLGFAFANNIVPANRLEPVAQNILKNHAINSPSPSYQIPYAAPSGTDEWSVITKIDYLVGKHAIMGRYLQGNNFARPSNDSKDIFWSAGAGFKNWANTLALTDTWTVTPGLLITGGFIFTKNQSQNGSFPNQLTWKEVGSTIEQQPGCLDFIWGTSVASIRTNDGCNKGKMASWELNNTVRFIRGKHELSVGWNLGKLRWYSDTYLNPGAYIYYNASFTGNNWADPIVGTPYTFSSPNFGIKTEKYRWMVGSFVQDNVRVSKKLTLNLGLRWQPGLTAGEPYGNLSWWVAGAKSTRFPNAPVGALYAGDPGAPETTLFPRWNQVAPRFGFALDPRGDGKWSIRGGIGAFISGYNDGGMMNTDGPYSPLGNFSITIPNPISVVNPWITPPYNTTYGGKSPFPLPPATAASAVAVPMSGNPNDPHAKSPVAWNYNLTIERSVGPALLLRAGYVGTRGYHLMGGYPENMAVYIPGASTQANLQQRRPDQNFGGFFVKDGNSDSWYHSFQFTAEKRYSHGLSLLMNYTFSKSIDTGSTNQAPPGSSYATIQDPRGPWYNKGLSDFDRPQNFNTSVIWDLPKFSGSSPVVKQVLGGWQTGGILYLRSGAPLTLLSSANNSLVGLGIDRAELVYGVPLNVAQGDRNQWFNGSGYFNPAAFSNPPLGGHGNTGRGMNMRGPGYADTDFTMSKSFYLRESVRLQFRSEFFNLFNRVNLANPLNNVNVPATFGKINTAKDPRILQFGLKLMF